MKDRKRASKKEEMMKMEFWERFGANKRKAQKVTAAFLAFLMLAGVAYAVVYTTWHGTVSWTVATQGFTVYSDSGATIEISTGQTVNLGQVVNPPQDSTLYYYIKNTGTIPVTVTVSNVVASGSSGVWSSGGVWTSISVGTVIDATLTLTVNGAGSYSFDFVAS